MDIGPGDMDLTYVYDPVPVGTASGSWFQPGATKGYLYLHDGKPGQGWVADAVWVQDDDGEAIWMPTSDFRPVTITDD